MKKLLFALFSVALLAVACQKFDDSSIWEKLNEYEARIAKLEQQCEAINTNISSMQTVLQALQKKDYVTSVNPVTKEGVVVGYVITFQNSGSITIYNGKDGKDGKDGQNGTNGTNGRDGVDGTNGADGHTPQVTVAQDSDGEWYWKVDGEWLLDAAGSKIRASSKDGATPDFKIEDGMWYVTTDKGLSWTSVAPAVSDPLFSDVTYDDKTVTFTLADGTQISLLRLTPEDFNIPTGIVMLSQSFNDVLKYDTLFVDIRVNPSNFPLKKEDLGLLCVTHTYSACIPGKKIEESPFDPDAKSNFEVVDIAPLTGFEGAYRVAVAVNGKGNYFEDATMFVVAGAKDSQDSLRSVCSATPCQVSVIPAIEDGLFVQAPEQSFFYISDAKAGITAKKDFILGVWSRQYKDENNIVKVYDRTKLGELTLCDSLAQSAKINNDYFKDYGLALIDIDTTTTFWQGELQKYRNGEAPFTELKGMTLGVSRKFEHKDIPFDMKVYYQTMITFNETMTSAEAKALKTKTYDIDTDLTNCGLPVEGYVGPLFHYYKDLGANVGVAGAFNQEERQFVADFRFIRPQPTSFNIDMQTYSIGGQNVDGYAYPEEGLPDTLCNMLLNVRIGINCTFTDL